MSTGKTVYIDEDGNEISERNAALQSVDAIALVQRLQDAALGNVLMVPTAISAALALLDRVLPALQRVEHTGVVQHAHLLIPENIEADQAQSKYLELMSVGRSH